MFTEENQYATNMIEASRERNKAVKVVAGQVAFLRIFCQSQQLYFTNSFSWDAVFKICHHNLNFILATLVFEKYYSR